MHFPIVLPFLAILLSHHAKCATVEGPPGPPFTIDREDALPTFVDISKDDACKYDMCLKVDFLGDKEGDILLASAEPDEPTILEGYMKNEAKVKVTIILEDEVTMLVVFKSRRSPGCTMFSLDGDMKAECIKGWHLEGTADEVDSELDRMERQSNERSLLDRAISPRALDPNGYVVKVAVYYDDGFQKQFKDKSNTRIKAVMAIVNNMYSEVDSLTTTVDVQLVGVKHAEGKDWSGDFGNVLDNELGPLAKDSEFDANLYIGVTGTTGSGALGLAPMASVCNSGRSRRINMNQYASGQVKNGDAYTAETIAHEMGHNMGMDHDFVQSKGPGNMRVMNGQACTGYMDYQDKTNQWSACSVSDFEAYLNGLQTNCLSTSTTGPTGPSSPCKDEYAPASCASWAKAGDCKNHWEQWMKDNCKKTCGHCATDVCAATDKYPDQCPKWANAGDCKNHWADWMKENCAKSCNHC